MSTGARTVLISRWRPAGQTSYELVREFAQELPHTSAADAWQRAVQLVSENPLDSDGEPRCAKRRPAGEAPKADHPFFWAAYSAGRLGPPGRRPGAAAAAAGEPEPETARSRRRKATSKAPRQGVAPCPAVRHSRPRAWPAGAAPPAMGQMPARSGRRQAAKARPRRPSRSKEPAKGQGRPRKKTPDPDDQT